MKAGSFARRAPRLPLDCSAMVSYGSLSHVGRTVEIGPRGVGMRIRERVPPGTPVLVLLDPASVPPPLAPLGGTALPGRVVTSRHVGSGSDGYLQVRLGIELHAMAAGPRGCLEGFVEAEMARTWEALAAPAGGLALAGSPDGRERLYQAALVATDQGRLEPARAAVHAALARASANRAYRALAARIQIEKALEAGDGAAARRALDRALGHFPDDRSLRALEARVDELASRPGPRRRFLGLFG